MIDLTGLIEQVRLKANLEISSATPLYLRVQRAIEETISAGLVKVNDALPAERELADALGVSRVTVRNAVRALVQKGLLTQRHGVGTFVSSRSQLVPCKVNSFTEAMHARGFETRDVWLDRSSGYPTPEEATALEISKDIPISRLYRLRLADERPICLEHVVLPSCILPDPQGLSGSLYAKLEQAGLRPSRARQTLSAQLLGASHAHLLEAAIGTPCLYIERTSYLPLHVIEDSKDLECLARQGNAQPPNCRRDVMDRPIEFVRAHFRGDLYQFATEQNI